MKKFEKWLDTFIEEKGIDLNEDFEIEGGLFEIMTYGCVIEAIKETTPAEQKKIQNKLVVIDFRNGDVKHFLKHLGKALVY